MPNDGWVKQWQSDCRVSPSKQEAKKKKGIKDRRKQWPTGEKSYIDLSKGSKKETAITSGYKVHSNKETSNYPSFAALQVSEVAELANWARKWPAQGIAIQVSSWTEIQGTNQNQDSAERNTNLPHRYKIMNMTHTSIEAGTSCQWMKRLSLANFANQVL